jgi:hypothetical protein
MKEILRLEVTQTRVFPIDRLPLEALGLPGPVQAFNTRFNWGGMNAPKPGEVRFEAGVLDLDGAPPIQIKQLELSAQRISLSVLGDSNRASRVFEEVSAFLGTIDPSGNWKGTEPVIFTQETNAVVPLNIDWRSLFSARFMSFQEQAVSRISEKSPGEAVVRSFSLTFRLSFNGAPPSLTEHGVTLADKGLVIEPRKNSPLADRVFFTASPTDSDTHLSLVRDLEKALGDESDPAHGTAKGCERPRSGHSR